MCLLGNPLESAIGLPELSAVNGHILAEITILCRHKSQENYVKL